MNLKKFRATLTAGVLASAMILPSMTTLAATTTAKPAGVITKTVTAADGITFSGEKFVYTFEQGVKGEVSNGEGTVEANTFIAAIPSVTITAGSETAENLAEMAVDQDGNKNYTYTVGTTANARSEVIDLSAITKAGVYTYTVTESEADSTTTVGETWKFDASTYEMRVYAKNGTSGLEYTITLIKTGGDGTKLETAPFTNSVTKSSTLKIAKSAANTDYAPDGQLYKFEITITPDKQSTIPDSGYAWVVKDENGEVSRTDDVATSGNTGADGKITVEIESGQYVEFTDVPAGSTAVAKEIDNPANVATTTAEAKVGDTTLSGSSYTLTDNATPSTLVDEKGTTITFTNTWKDVTVTGVVTNIAPYITLVAAATAAVAAYVVMKRRIAR